MTAPPHKFEPKAPNPSAPTRDGIVTFGGTSATLLSAAWDVIGRIYMAVETYIMETGDVGQGWQM
eukprot:12859366-Prorocentrum_lima.AAC.1